MKNVIWLIGVLIFWSINLFAQIPNGGFESWTSMGAYSIPASWSTLNGTAISADVYTCEQGTPGYSGNSYLKLTSKKNTSGTVVQGIAVCGTLNTTSIQPAGGFPFSQRPVNLTGCWQYMYGSSSSKGYIDVKLTRWDPVQNQRVTVASLHQALQGMVMSWTNFSIPLTYSDTNNPDTCIVVLAASNNTPMEYDYLYMDNLGFDGYVTGITEETAISNDYFTLFPNPVVSEKLSISSTYAEEAVVMIYDVSGVLLKTERVSAHQKNISTGDLTNGCYTVVVKIGDSIFNRKLIVQRM